MARRMDKENIREIRIDPVVPTQSVLISTSRGKRPGRERPARTRIAHSHDRTCPFCRGNEHLTPSALLQVPESEEWGIRIVENLYPVLDDEKIENVEKNMALVDDNIKKKERKKGRKKKRKKKRTTIPEIKLFTAEGNVFIGKILRETEDALFIKTMSGKVKIEKSRIEKREKL